MDDTTTALTFTFDRVLTEEEKAEVVGMVDGWEGAKRAELDAYPSAHVRRLKAAELRPHYEWCDPDRPNRRLADGHAPDDDCKAPRVGHFIDTDCTRTDHEPLECRDCHRGLVNPRGTVRQLMCARLHPFPFRFPVADRTVIECGRPG